MVKEHWVAEKTAIDVCNYYLSAIGKELIAPDSIVIPQAASQTQPRPQKKAILVAISASVLILTLIITIAWKLNPRNEAMISEPSDNYPAHQMPTTTAEEHIEGEFTTDDQFIQTENGIFISTPNGIFHIKNSVVKQVYDKGNRFATDGHTIYTVEQQDDSIEVIQIEVESGASKTLFTLSGEGELEGVMEGNIYLSYITLEESAAILNGGDFVGYHLNCYDQSGYLSGSFEVGQLDNKSGYLIYKGAAPMGEPFPCQVYFNGELILEESYIADISVYNDKVYYLVGGGMGAESEDTQLYSIEGTNSNLIATFPNSEQKRFTFAPGSSGVVMTGDEFELYFEFDALSFYDILTGDMIDSNVVMPISGLSESGIQSRICFDPADQSRYLIENYETGEIKISKLSTESTWELINTLPSNNGEDQIFCGIANSTAFIFHTNGSTSESIELCDLR